MVNLNDVVIKNVIVFIEDNPDKVKMDKLRETLKSLDKHQVVNELLKHYEFVFEGGIADYVLNTFTDKESLTMTVNRLILTMLNLEGCPISKDSFNKRKDFDKFVDYDYVTSLLFEDYTRLVKTVFPEINIILQEINLFEYWKETLKTDKYKIRLMDIPAFKNKDFTFREALEILYTTDRSSLTMLSPTEIEEYKSLGLVEPLLAMEVIIAQALNSRDSVIGSPLDLFLHSLQHYYGHTMYKDNFKESLQYMIKTYSESLSLKPFEKEIIADSLYEFILEQ